MTAAAAFARRDLRIAWSYRVAFFTRYSDIVWSLVGLRLLGGLVAESPPASLAAYGGDYFSFALVGLAITMLAYPATRLFSQAIREAQVTGTLEAILATGISPLRMVLGSALYPLSRELTKLAVTLAAAALLLGAQFRPEGALVLAGVVAVTLVMLVGVGLLSAAFTLAFKQQEPLTAIFVAGSLMLSGVLYPVSVLPGPLQQIAAFAPLTHVLEVARGVLLEQAQVESLATSAALMAAFCVALASAGLAAFAWSVRYARRAGTLAQY